MVGGAAAALASNVCWGPPLCVYTTHGPTSRIHITCTRRQRTPPHDAITRSHHHTMAPSHGRKTVSSGSGSESESRVRLGTRGPNRQGGTHNGTRTLNGVAEISAQARSSLW